jgi:hypothetical protein
MAVLSQSMRDHNAQRLSPDELPKAMELHERRRESYAYLLSTVATMIVKSNRRWTDASMQALIEAITEVGFYSTEYSEPLVDFAAALVQHDQSELTLRLSRSINWLKVDLLRTVSRALARANQLRLALATLVAWSLDDVLWFVVDWLAIM